MPAGEEQVRSVIVMGATGSGKSETIRQLGGKHVETGKLPETSEGFASCAKEWATYNTGEYDNFKYHLIDTVGLMDTNRDDEKAVESIEKLLEQLTTVVGVIYVVAGKMNPPEVEICDFLFNTFFHEIPLSRLLVLRTKVSRWQDFDVEFEKENLRGRSYVPGRFLEAELIAVDFHPAYESEEIEKMTGSILSHIKSWDTCVQLRRAEKPVTFVPKYKKVEELEKVSAANEEEKNALIQEKRKLEEEKRKYEQMRETSSTQSQSEGGERKQPSIPLAGSDGSGSREDNGNGVGKGNGNGFLKSVGKVVWGPVKAFSSLYRSN